MYSEWDLEDQTLTNGQKSKDELAEGIYPLGEMLHKD